MSTNSYILLPLQCLFVPVGATVEVLSSSTMMQEGNTGDLTPFELCVRLTNIQNGLERDLAFSVSVGFNNAGKNTLLRE